MRVLYYVIDDLPVLCYWSVLNQSYACQDRRNEQHISNVIKEGSRFYTTSYPGKRFPSIFKALCYIADMRRKAR